MSLNGGRRTRGEASVKDPAKPLISVVTVVYNGAATLQRTIESVLNQAYPNVEYIIIDGNSNDGTLDIIKSFDDRLDYWVSEKDDGIYDAMNKGVKAATGEFIGLINADDWYQAEAIARIAKAIAGNPSKKVFHGDIWIHYPNGQKKIKKARTSGFLLKYWEMVMNHPSFFVHKSLYEARLFDTELRVGADHKWTLSTFMEQSDRFHYIEEPISNFSAGGASMTIPLSKVLAEGKQMGRSLGFNGFEILIGQMVKILLYLPQYGKLLFNQYIGGSAKGVVE